jgi:hypothetical protein
MQSPAAPGVMRANAIVRSLPCVYRPWLACLPRQAAGSWLRPADKNFTAPHRRAVRFTNTLAEQTRRTRT